MMRSLYSGVSGLKTHQTKMDVIGNNIANVNTVAFKSSTTTFSEIMYQTTSNASGATLTKGGVNAKQIGLGVTTGSTSVNITSPGATQTTGDPFDLKITGDSFFVVNNGSQNLFTKAGSFGIDGLGNLVTKANGYNVMGWQVDPTTGQIRKDTVSPLRIMQEGNKTSAPEATTQGNCGGVLDSNDTSVNGADGYTMSLSFFDSLGYSYNAKFAVKSVNPVTKTYTVELKDILDSTNHSVLTDYVNGGGTVDDVFGIASTVNTDYTLSKGYTFNGGNYFYNDGSGAAGFPVQLTYDAANKRYSYTDPAAGKTVNVAVSTMFHDGSGNAMSASVAAAYNPANILGNGTGTYRVTDTAYTYELDFDQNTGLFDYIGAPNAGNGDAVFLNMSALGGQFSNVSVDFSQTKCYDNKGTCTMAMDKGAKDGVTGKGRKLGELIGLSISENGEI
ncbi:MAG: flagellar hook-basal body complex protein, partial [Lachnospiraceae bacterium]